MFKSWKSVISPDLFFFFLVPPSLSLQVLALCIIQLERVRGCRSSVFLFLFWVMAVVCSLVPLRAKVQLAMDEVRPAKPPTRHPSEGGEWGGLVGGAFEKYHPNPTTPAHAAFVVHILSNANSRR